jgi:hypothetical protein
MKEPAHKTLIDRYLDWDLVKRRLGNYRNIGKHYTLNNLQGCSNKAPFYCHYLAWRLGTWKDENWFEFFDSLLSNATNLPNWNKTRISQAVSLKIFGAFYGNCRLHKCFQTKRQALNGQTQAQI